MAELRPKKKTRPVIGWREWVSLPDLGIPAIKAKIDTGARSSSLHAFDLQIVERRGLQVARFSVHPRQRTGLDAVRAEAEVVEFREVKSSSGHVTTRPVIATPVELLGQRWTIELTLANRDEMGFRMLLGRQAVRRRWLVDPGRSFLGGRPAKTRTGAPITSKGKKKKSKLRQGIDSPGESR